MGGKQLAAVQELEALIAEIRRQGFGHGDAFDCEEFDDALAAVIDAVAGEAPANLAELVT
ncbi:MAG TPA: hypothetical protein VMX12_01390 [Acidimicrobiia bacterium]|nr:hypothetical protein [Acidimicrobiia bacterium]